MKMDDDARDELDETVEKILAGHPLPEDERAGARTELESHLHSAAEAKAEEAGRDAISAGDLQAAVLDAGGEAGLAEAFVEPRAGPTDRGGLGDRIVAFVVDMLIIGFMAVPVGTAIFRSGFLAMIAPSAQIAPVIRDPSILLAFPPLTRYFLPYAILGIVALLYFPLLEGAKGTTVGKWALGLRVVKEDGDRIGYGDALLRNLAKFAPPVLILDVLVGFLVEPDQKQRLSDRLADTVVVEG